MSINSKKEKQEENALERLSKYSAKNNKTLNYEDIRNNKNIIEILVYKNQEKTNKLLIEKIIFEKFYKKYKVKYNPKRMYNELIMYTLLFNKNTHLVSVFKDYMIYDYVDEFFKRFYTDFETNERLPKFAMFYKNYLAFFCQPCFSDFHYNNLIQKNREKKAELFYNKNFRDNKETIEDEGIIEDTNEEDEEIEKSKIEKTIFNETVKKKIERYSPINTSMALPESETHLKKDQSGLLISYDNANSLRNILKNMIGRKKKLKNNFGEEMSTIKKGKISFEIDGKNKKIENITKQSNNNKKICKNNQKKVHNMSTNKDKNSVNNDNKINTCNNEKFKHIKAKKSENIQNNNINNYNKKHKLYLKNLDKNLLTSSNNAFNFNHYITTNNENNKHSKEKNIYIKKIELIKIKKK
jgi:hypothetical protein